MFKIKNTRKKHLKLANALICLKFLLNKQKWITKGFYEIQYATLIDCVKIKSIKFLNEQKTEKESK